MPSREACGEGMVRARLSNLQIFSRICLTREVGLSGPPPHSPRCRSRTNSPKRQVCRGKGNGQHGITRKIGRPSRNALCQPSLVNSRPDEITNTTFANEKGSSGPSAHLNTHHRLLARGLCPAVYRAQRLCPLLNVRSGELRYRASGRF